VEAAVPGSFTDLLTNKLQYLITFISGLLILAGAFFNDGTLFRFGFILLFFVVGFTFIKYLLRKIIIGKTKTVKWILRFIVWLLAIIVLLIAVTGIYYFPDALEKTFSRLRHVIGCP
jgi:hypothetical protein